MDAVIGIVEVRRGDRSFIRRTGRFDRKIVTQVSKISFELSDRRVLGCVGIILRFSLDR